MAMPREFDTDNLSFRLPVRRDYNDLAAMRADPVVARYTSLHPASEADSWDRLMRYRGYWEILDFGYWFVREKATGRFVGTMGFGETRRGIEPSLDGFPEAGWVLASWCHGRGYGTEGVPAILHWLDTYTPHKTTRCNIDPQNTASMRLAARNGFEPLGRALYQGTEIVILERRRLCP